MSAPASPPVNSAEFAGTAANATLLRARGFDPKTGARSGGIRDPRIVTLPANIVLLRFYHDPARRFGEWWCTPHEAGQIVDHFGRAAPAFGEGRMQGKGILHAVLAVRHDWSGGNPGHLGLLTVIRLTRPLSAYYGEGDVAPSAAQDQTLKPVQIMDSRRRLRGVRQVFLPVPWKYPGSFSELQNGGSSDSDLLGMVRRYQSSPLPFEA